MLWKVQKAMRGREDKDVSRLLVEVRVYLLRVGLTLIALVTRHAFNEKSRFNVRDLVVRYPVLDQHGAVSMATGWRITRAVGDAQIGYGQF